MIVPEAEAVEFWQALLAAGVAPAGLGARDTLRLEAGMNLYGSEMSDEVSPLESALTWTVDLSNKNRRFIGRDALEVLKNKGDKKTIVGLILEGKGVIRDQQKVMTNLGEGEVT